MDSQLRLVHPKPIYWIPSGKTDWPSIISSISVWLSLLIFGGAFWWEVARVVRKVVAAD